MGRHDEMKVVVRELQNISTWKGERTGHDTEAGTKRLQFLTTNSILSLDGPPNPSLFSGSHIRLA